MQLRLHYLQFYIIFAVGVFLYIFAYIYIGVIPRWSCTFYYITIQYIIILVFHLLGLSSEPKFLLLLGNNNRLLTDC